MKNDDNGQDMTTYYVIEDDESGWFLDSCGTECKKFPQFKLSKCPQLYNVLTIALFEKERAYTYFRRYYGRIIKFKLRKVIFEEIIDENQKID